MALCIPFGGWLLGGVSSGGLPHEGHSRKLSVRHLQNEDEPLLSMIMIDVSEAEAGDMSRGTPTRMPTEEAQPQSLVSSRTVDIM